MRANFNADHQARWLFLILSVIRHHTLLKKLVTRRWPVHIIQRVHLKRTSAASRIHIKKPPISLDFFIPSKDQALLSLAIICSLSFYSSTYYKITIAYQPQSFIAMISIAALIPVFLMLQASALIIPHPNRDLGVRYDLHTTDAFTNYS